MTYDLLIIGGGPAGYRAAERAGHKGMSVVLFEARSLGGVCLNEGCIKLFFREIDADKDFFHTFVPFKRNRHSCIDSTL